jgi:hypothetical protein
MQDIWKSVYQVKARPLHIPDNLISCYPLPDKPLGPSPDILITFLSVEISGHFGLPVVLEHLRYLFRKNLGN